MLRRQCASLYRSLARRPVCRPQQRWGAAHPLFSLKAGRGTITTKSATTIPPQASPSPSPQDTEARGDQNKAAPEDRRQQQQQQQEFENLATELEALEEALEEYGRREGGATPWEDIRRTSKEGEPLLRDGIQYLMDDHRFMQKQFKRFEAAKTSFEKRKIFDAIRRKFSSHSDVEHKIFYPIVERTLNAQELTECLWGDHLRVDRLMKEIEVADPRSSEFIDHMRTVIDMINEHIALEEREVFGKLRAKLSPESFEEMYRTMEAEGTVDQLKASKRIE